MIDFIPDLDDATQRLKENPPDLLEYIRQVHEEWLSELEGLAVEAIATNDWSTFYAHVVDFQNEHELHGESFIVSGEAFPCLTVRHGTENKNLKPAPKVCPAQALTFPQTECYEPHD